MALVVFLRGVNVGGHRTFRPTALARQLRRLDVVNIGAAGTFVVRQPISRAALRAELARRLPFQAEAMICGGREIAALVADGRFAGQPAGRDVVRFVSILARRPRKPLATPVSLPSSGRWLVRIVAGEGRLVLGQYRRHMRTIGYLGALDRLYGAPATTRNWNTILAVAEVLEGSPRRR